jgi:hypothetical protein
MRSAESEFLRNMQGIPFTTSFRSCKSCHALELFNPNFASPTTFLLLEPEWPGFRTGSWPIKPSDTNARQRSSGPKETLDWPRLRMSIPRKPNINSFTRSGRPATIDFPTALWATENYTIMHNKFYINTSNRNYRSKIQNNFQREFRLSPIGIETSTKFPFGRTGLVLGTKFPRMIPMAIAR